MNNDNNFSPDLEKAINDLENNSIPDQNISVNSETINLGAVQPNVVNMGTTLTNENNNTIDTLDVTTTGLPDLSMITPQESTPIKEEPKKKKKSKLLLILIIIIVLLSLGYAYLFVFMSAPKVFDIMIDKSFAEISKSIDPLNNHTSVLYEGSITSDNSGNKLEIINDYIVNYKFGINKNNNILIALNLADKENTLLDFEAYEDSNNIYLKSSSLEDVYKIGNSSDNLKNSDISSLLNKLKDSIKNAKTSYSSKKIVSVNINGKSTLAFENKVQLRINQLSSNLDTELFSDIKENDSALSVTIYTNILSTKVLKVVIVENANFIEIESAKEKVLVKSEIKDGISVYKINGSFAKNDFEINMSESDNTYKLLKTGTNLELYEANNLVFMCAIDTNGDNSKVSLSVGEETMIFNIKNKVSYDGEISKIDIATAKDFNNLSDEDKANILLSLISGIMNQGGYGYSLKDDAELLINDAYYESDEDENSNICYSTDYFKNTYYSDNELTGSVLVKSDGNILVWITNGDEYISAVNEDDLNSAEIHTGEIPESINVCGNSKSVEKICTANGCTIK